MKNHGIRAAIVILAACCTAGLAPLAAQQGNVAQKKPAIPGLRENIEFAKVGDESLTLDAYVPEGKGPFPTCILVHGGGFTRGDKQTFITPLFAPLSKAGFTWFTINYRLAPKHRWPACADDVASAIRWVRKHAAEYKVDSQRIAIIGESAGGHLVSWAGTHGKDDTAVAAVVPFYAPHDLEFQVRERKELGPSMTALLGLTDLNDAAFQKLRAASPTTHLHKNMPPYLLIHGDADKTVPYDQSTRFRKQMKELGNPCELITVSGGGHGMGGWDKSGSDYREQMIAWLKKTLGSVSTPPTQDAGRRNDKSLDVLFIGNSQIYFNDLPRMVEALAESAPADRPRIRADRLVAGGASLERHWNAGDGKGTARAKIMEKKWDFVVLQDIYFVKSDGFNKYATLFHELVQKNGSRTVLFCTASVNAQYPKGFQELHDMHIALGNKLQVPVAAAGKAWLSYWGEAPSAEDRLVLYHADKAHPGLKGSYIYACVLYAALTGHSPVGLSRHVPKQPEDTVTATEAERFQEAAWRVHQQETSRPPYDVFPAADPPYYRVRYEASAQKGELVYPVNYTIWIPKGVKSLRGVIVHQHGCGEGSCKSGLTGAYDLHWQALARKHDCALLAPAYEQPDKADCQMWCDPRNGSDTAFRKCLVDLGARSGHPELAKIPWALWGHSGGGHWAGGMVLLHPDRVAAAWLRSGVPMFKADPKRPTIKTHMLPDAALKVPVMCNLGTKEGVTVKDTRFAGVWPANEAFFNEVRGKGGLIGVAVDPLASHECGNQRYFAIPWLDACLSARLPIVSGNPLKAMPTDQAWLAPVTGVEAVPAAKFAGDSLKAGWLPSEAIARAWMQYVNDTAVTDTTPPPAPTNLRLKGNELTWEADADLESGLASFIIERDGKFLANVPEQAKNLFGRPIFQNLQYSDTPTQPLVPLRYVDTTAEPGKEHTYRVIAVNTVGLKSMPARTPSQ